MAAVCREATKNPWSRRLDAFRLLLNGAVKVRSGSTPLVHVHDLDALSVVVRDHTRWDDAHFATERNALLDVVIEYAGRHGLFAFSRPEPSRRVTHRIEKTQPSAEQFFWSDQGLPDHAAVGAVDLPPDEARLAQWLVQRGALEAEDIGELPAWSRSRALLTTAWEVLRPSVRDDAMRIGLVRTEMRRNGHLGPLAFEPARKSGVRRALGVREASVDTLVDAGFLRRGAEAATWEMPRRVRRFVSEHARWLAPAGVDETRIAISHASRGRGSEEDVLEAHWHAVAACDVQLAEETATFYGTDLRVSAVRIGTDAHRLHRAKQYAKANEGYARAAKLFESIMERFDPEDAYAWEYAGYNLWQPHRRRPREAPPAVAERTLAAFTKACEYAELNPLFRGRLIGLKASLGKPFQDELRQWLGWFRRHYGDDAPERLTWLVEPVVNALRDDHDLLSEIRAFPLVTTIEEVIERRRRGDDGPLSHDG